MLTINPLSINDRLKKMSRNELNIFYMGFLLLNGVVYTPVFLEQVPFKQLFKINVTH